MSNLTKGYKEINVDNASKAQLERITQKHFSNFHLYGINTLLYQFVFRFKNENATTYIGINIHEEKHNCIVVSEYWRITYMGKIVEMKSDDKFYPFITSFWNELEIMGKSQKRQPPPPKIDSATLHSLFNITVPLHMEANSNHEIIINLHNTSGMVLNEIFADTSLFNEFFNIEGELRLNTLNPGMELEKRIKISPKYDRGVFPIKMRLHCGGAVIEKEYTIKVGGTEIY